MSKAHLLHLADEAERDCQRHPELAETLRRSATGIDADDREAWGLLAVEYGQQLDALIEQAMSLGRVATIVREAHRVCVEAAGRERVPVSSDASEGRGDETE